MFWETVKKKWKLLWIIINACSWQNCVYVSETCLLVSLPQLFSLISMCALN